jgi:hypothetical protein
MILTLDHFTIKIYHVKKKLFCTFHDIYNKNYFVLYKEKLQCGSFVFGQHQNWLINDDKEHCLLIHNKETP